MLCQEQVQLCTDVFYVRFFFRSQSHEVEAVEQSVVDSLLFQIEADQHTADKFSLCQYVFLVDRCKTLAGKVPQSPETIDDGIDRLLLDRFVIEQFVGEIDKPEFKPAYLVMRLFCISVEKMGSYSGQTFCSLCSGGQNDYLGDTFVNQAEHSFHFLY